MLMRKLLILLLMTGGCLPVVAAEKGEGSPVINFVRKVGTFLDTMAVKGLDSRYIEAPKKPWQSIVQGNVNQSDLKMKSEIHGEAMFEDVKGIVTWEPRVLTDMASYVGVWAGYRGYGIGYSKNIGGDEGSIFKLGATGGAYGINLRIHKFETDEPKVRIRGMIQMEEGGPYEHLDETNEYPLIKPISVKTVSLDGYYLFNGKRFSYCAAYDQSVIQKRSAGSFMVGAMYYYSNIEYDHDYNADFILFMNDIGSMKQRMISAGPGYAYNFVPCKGLLISALAMPMVTFYNRLDVWHYNSNLRESLVGDDGANLDFLEYEIYASEGKHLITYPEKKDYKKTHHSRISPTFDARLSLTYNIGDWFINAYGQFNNYRYSYGDSSGRLNDWYINASVGIRL